jgi:hypothetical protein
MLRTSFLLGCFALSSGCLLDRRGTESALFDAGAEAGEADARDSGASDSGLIDSALSDTGPFDSGLFDSGPFDSGSFDSGPFDSGPFDSGSLDSGVDAGVDAGRDSGPEDSGPPDAPFDSGPPPTCYALFGMTSGYALCAETADRCDFFSVLGMSGTCSSVCSSAGQTCLDAYSKSSNPQFRCNRNSANQQSCSDNSAGAVCICSRM